MSFFNLTYMGYDNAVAQSLDQKTPTPAEGSHVKFTDMKTKHTRNEKGGDSCSGDFSGEFSGDSCSGDLLSEECSGDCRGGELNTGGNAWNYCTVLPNAIDNPCSQDQLIYTETLWLPLKTTGGGKKTAKRHLSGPNQLDVLTSTVKWRGIAK